MDIDYEQPDIGLSIRLIDEPRTDEDATVLVAHRRQRQKRIRLAWSTSLVSKVATVGVQLLAVPLVYRALGDGGYAAYAAVTASAGLIAALNLGIGGSLVTPIADAAARLDERRQAALIQAGLGPLLMLCIGGSIVVLPTVAYLPLTTLFGRVGATGSANLRIAALIAAAATLATIPLSAITFIRQAYQELHVSNLIGAVSNVILCVVLLMAARRSTAVSVFVAIFVLIPLAASAFNLGFLFLKRPYLLRSAGKQAVKDSRHLLADGIRFFGASFSSVLIYQWPVYWIARSMPPSSSSLFAICMQAVVLPLASIIGFLQPLWPSTADAVARKDHHWVEVTMRQGSRVIVAIGVSAFIIALFFGERLLHLWLRKPVTLDWPVRGLMGAYLFLAIWEYYHFMLALGFGRLRQAASAVFCRSTAFALAVPLLARIGGIQAIWLGMCLSILLWTAWRLPGSHQPHVPSSSPEAASE